MTQPSDTWGDPWQDRGMPYLTTAPAAGHGLLDGEDARPR